MGLLLKSLVKSPDVIVSNLLRGLSEPQRGKKEFHATTPRGKDAKKKSNEKWIRLCAFASLRLGVKILSYLNSIAL
ncbi:MAG: hypothetical protein A2V67_11030 [Deltaproteobacteria bacterium RBG_13_61_14]|nr:MAG: hypothetical protein A2V67_11030 [Deltaproteobacteria bacterium RBG_13_61_14]